MSRPTELEIVNFRREDMQTATIEMVTLFSKHSGIAGTDEWMHTLLNIQEYYKKMKSHDWSLSAKGLDLTFSGFPNPVPTIEEGHLVEKAREPRFILEPVFDELRPAERTQIEKATTAIAMEMHEVYNLKVEPFPTTLIFPKDRYAQVERIGAVLL